MEGQTLLFCVAGGIAGIALSAWIFKIIAIDPVIKELQIIKEVLMNKEK
jgi:hypothetical protein